MVARQKSRRVAGKPLEDTDTSRNLKALESVKGKRQMQKDEPVKIGPPVGVEKQKEWQVVGNYPPCHLQKECLVWPDLMSKRKSWLCKNQALKIEHLCSLMKKQRS